MTTPDSTYGGSDAGVERNVVLGNASNDTPTAVAAARESETQKQPGNPTTDSDYTGGGAPPAGGSALIFPPTRQGGALTLEWTGPSTFVADGTTYDIISYWSLRDRNALDDDTVNAFILGRSGPSTLVFDTGTVNVSGATITVLDGTTTQYTGPYVLLALLFSGTTDASLAYTPDASEIPTGELGFDYENDSSGHTLNADVPITLTS